MKGKPEPVRQPQQQKPYVDVAFPERFTLYARHYVIDETAGKPDGTRVNELGLYAEDAVRRKPGIDDGSHATRREKKESAASMDVHIRYSYGEKGPRAISILSTPWNMGDCDPSHNVACRMVSGVYGAKFDGVTVEQPIGRAAHELANAVGRARHEARSRGVADGLLITVDPHDPGFARLKSLFDEFVAVAYQTEPTESI